MKVLTVVGARPQFVKAAVVSRAIAEHNAAHPAAALREEIVHTGQHYDWSMSEAFFEEMEIPRPSANLQVGSGPHGAVTGVMLAGLEREIADRRPRWVLVYGDTNSTLAGALAAAKLGVPVAHVEAGMRSFNRSMPEEINRVLTDHLAEMLFCPSENGRRLLAAEGVTRGVHVAGDVMYDALLHYGRRATPPAQAGPFALATLHRAENADDPSRLRRILAALGRSPVPVLLPLHPRTRESMRREGLSAGGAVRLLDPQPYFSMLGHLRACEFVITDSGGLQKEAFYLGKRCVTVREETEWTELVECGANRLVGTDESEIEAAFDWASRPLGEVPAVYGRGDAGARIVRLLAETGESLPPAGRDGS